MSQNPAFDKLIRLLKELFQLDQPDLDFGLYRIMHARAREISQFLDRDLLPQVQEAFTRYRTADKADLEKELTQVIEQANNLGVDPEASPKVQDLRRKIAEQGVDVTGLAHEVYDHLYKFFRRYYHEGDFLAKRVYKPGVYAIPYEGEEVKLHWANKDQYYIKTSEYLRDYAFVLKPGAKDDPMRVHFRLKDVAEGEHGNIKAGEDQNRVFILAEKDFIAEEDGESGRDLVIYFEYRPATLADWSEAAREQATDAARKKPPVQQVLRDDAVRRILAINDDTFRHWLTELAQPHTKANGEQADYCRLAAHLNRYTAKNTFDYFIHKDLGGFLRRELDFYIKTEVMHLDDIESETAPRVEQYLSKIKIIRQVAGKIIDFLAQLENFQKKLWLKKKFVTETSWCIRVGCIPESFFPAIAANDQQREEWVRLHAIDEIQEDMFAADYSEPLTPEFLKAHPTLMVDTQHFDDGFTHQLLEAMGDIDGQTDGILYHSDNFQVLSLLKAKFLGKIKCVHIDPPYNTQTSGFLYKNEYKHSSWLTMMENRFALATALLNSEGSILCHIDENEYERMCLLLDDFPVPNAGTIAWDKRNPMNAGRGIATQHEYIAWRSWCSTPLYLRNESVLSMLRKANEIISRHGKVNETAKKEYASWVAGDENLSGGEKAYRHLDEEGRPYQSVSLRAPEPRSDPKFHKPLIHPVTQKPCPVPPNGFSRTPETLQAMIERGDIIFGTDETTQPRQKVILKEGTKRQISSVIQDARKGKADLDPLGLGFAYCHPVSLYEVLLGAAAEMNEDWVFDYFAGSGTTGHAVIDLNRDNGIQRKFILAEMGDYFDTVLLPRLKKVTFTPEWKAGRPKRLATAEEAERSPRIIKVIRLESYEDALNNLALCRDESQESLLAFAEAQGPGGLREQYLLRYMLDVETRGSRSLLNIRAFTDPAAYRLKVKRPGSEETREVNVDLLETFNWLIGLTVDAIAAPRTVTAAFTRDTDPDLPKDAPRRLLLDGRVREDSNGPWWFRTVAGTIPDGRRTLVIWRKLTGNPEQDNLVLDEWFKKQGYAGRDSKFDLIYVNGDNNLENLCRPGETWKVRLIEEDFHRLMFEEAGA
jgi:adenine-specific DNA-methyltransferase